MRYLSLVRIKRKKKNYFLASTSDSDGKTQQMFIVREVVHLYRSITNINPRCEKSFTLH